MPNRLQGAARLLSALVLLFAPLAAWTQAGIPGAPQGFDRITSAGGLTTLAKQLAETGRTRVIVTLATPFRAAGYLEATAAAQQAEGITAMQAQVLNELEGTAVENVTRYRYTPQIALTVDGPGLQRLLSSGQVLYVAEDELVPYHLDLSVPRIGAPSLWSGGNTGAGVAVAVLDTGVDKNHAFLTGAVVSEACYSNANQLDGANCGTNCLSYTICPGGVRTSTAVGSALPYGGSCATGGAGGCDHGTHVAGIVAGRNNGSFSGVAPAASIIAIQVFSRFTGAGACGGAQPCILAYNSDIMSGLQRVVDLRTNYNIAAVNMSLGGGQFFANCDSDSRKPLIDTLRSFNIATVISSGNSGFTNSMGAPGCISSAVSVGATTDADGVAAYSNSATFLNLLAPGSSINSSIPGGFYSSYNGTSMAAPHVAGAWALLRQARPSATVTEVLNALSSTGVAITDAKSPSITKPRIQVNLALASLLPPSLGPGKTGVFRGGFWFNDLNGNLTWDGSTVDGFFAFGTAGDQAVVGDWNGDGRAKIGVFRNGFFFLDYNGNGLWDGGAIDRFYAFGTTGDIPVVGDWNNSGTAKIGVFRNGFFFLDHNGNGLWDGTAGGDLFYAFGTTGDQPVAGDWSGNGYAKIGIFRNGFFFLDYNGNGRWDGSFFDIFYAFGAAGDKPVAADWNGNSLAKVGVYRNGFWFVDANGDGVWSGSTVDRFWAFGATGDLPVAGKGWNPVP